MFNIQPTKIEAIGADQYKVWFIRTKDGTTIAYTFHFSDNPRGISGYDKEFYFDTQDDPAETWLSRSLLSFDKARELGIVSEDHHTTMVPSVMAVEFDSPASSSYLLKLDTDTGSKSYLVTITGNSENREASWDFGTCKTWLERGQFRFEDDTPSFQPLLKAVLRLHEARQFENEGLKE